VHGRGVNDGAKERNQGMKKVPEFLHNAAAIYEERNKLYGDNYKRPFMNLLFPNGITLQSKNDFTRFGVFSQIVSKVTRYAEQFNKGGHPDSLDDLSVYSMMLKELDELASDKEFHPFELQQELPFDGAAEVDRIRGKR
jgi:hypothetical protein